MTPSERVRRMVESGSVAPEEGARLLAAMGGTERRSGLGLLVDPFERFGGGTAVLAGAVVSAVSVVVSVALGARFDGFLDLHFSSSSPGLRVALVDQLAGWIVPALGFWLYARVVARHVRLVDFVGMTGLARLPILAGAIVLRPLAPSSVAGIPRMSPSLLLLALLAVVVLVANVTWLYKGFKNASGLSGSKLVGGFVVLSIIVEAASKLVIWSASHV